MNGSPKTSTRQTKMQRFLLESLLAMFRTTELKETVPVLDKGRMVKKTIQFSWVGELANK